MKWLQTGCAAVLLVLAVWLGLDPPKTQPAWKSYIVSVALCANALLILPRTPHAR